MSFQIFISTLIVIYLITAHRLRSEEIRKELLKEIKQLKEGK